jgi:hypothetical protein
MSKEKILREHQISQIYREKDWAMLKSKREKALKILKIFEIFKPYIYGSIARGNVHEESDIDVIFLNQIPPFQIEMVLEKNGITNYYKEIIIATPQDSIRLYIHVSELECITVPLTRLGKKNLQFYAFGGKIDLNQLKQDIRVPGIDKRLVLIKPTLMGHDEVSVIGNEHLAAKEVGINITTVTERERVLLRREKHGRTGVFFKQQIDASESTEEVLKKIANKNSLVRKKLYKR